LAFRPEVEDAGNTRAIDLQYGEEQATLTRRLEAQA
jgi:hypothetical protein